MATTQASYSVIPLPEAAAPAAQTGFGLGTEAGARGRVYVRRDLEIGSFGVNAFYQAASGEIVVGEHDELAPGASGHEELYAVFSGHALFTIAGGEVDAPAGTFVYVSDPLAQRKAVAKAADTVIVSLGGWVGKAFEPSDWETESLVPDA